MNIETKPHHSGGTMPGLINIRQLDTLDYLGIRLDRSSVVQSSDDILDKLVNLYNHVIMNNHIIIIDSTFFSFVFGQSFDQAMLMFAGNQICGQATCMRLQRWAYPRAEHKSAYPPRFLPLRCRAMPSHRTAMPARGKEGRSPHLYISRTL